MPLLVRGTTYILTAEEDQREYLVRMPAGRGVATVIVCGRIGAVDTPQAACSMLQQTDPNVSNAVVCPGQQPLLLPTQPADFLALLDFSYSQPWVWMSIDNISPEITLTAVVVEGLIQLRSHGQSPA